MMRTAEVLVGESDGFEHGAGRSLVAPVGDATTAVFEVHGLQEYAKKGYDMGREDDKGEGILLKQ